MTTMLMVFFNNANFLKGHRDLINLLTAFKDLYNCIFLYHTFIDLKMLLRNRNNNFTNQLNIQ